MLFPSRKSFTLSAASVLLALCITHTATANPTTEAQCVQISIANDLPQGSFSVLGDPCHPTVFANGYVQNNFLLIPNDTLSRAFKKNSMLTIQDAWGNFLSPSIKLNTNMNIECARSLSGATCIANQ